MGLGMDSNKVDMTWYPNKVHTYSHSVRLHVIPLMNAPPNKVDNYCHNYMVQLRPII